ncbi:hypothetical protein KFU94_46590 [Chloroflexi bacterium TSY]|nr:hypothetical protein [Chloroflexi bacterium TSY]
MIVVTLFIGESWFVVLTIAIATACGFCLLLYVNHQQVQKLHLIILNKIHLMLKDEILNQLAIILLNIPRADLSTEVNQRRTQRIQKSVAQLSDLVNNLSDETLQQRVDLDNLHHL